MKKTFAVRSVDPEGLLTFIGLASTELSFCCYTSYKFLSPKRAIQEDFAINNKDLV